MDPKWTGTADDKRKMRTLGLKQVVRRNFGFLPMVGLASTLIASWETVAVVLAVGLSNGGTAGYFWNYLIAAVGLGLAYASIAELGSMFPTSGGQYYWVAILAPQSCRRYLSYITGWLCAFTWQTAIAGASYICGTLIQGLFVLNIKTYEYQRWHGSLLAAAVILLAVLFNTLLATKLPFVESILIVLHVLGVAIFIPVLVLSPKSNGGSPLVEFFNLGGWASDGLATMVGSTAAITALIGFDCSIHMSEEANDSPKAVPYTLLFGYTLNVVLGFFSLMTCIYTIGPLNEDVLAPATGYPIINIFFNATNSYAATNGMTAILIINLAAATISSLAAASRQLWAFARNRGVPFSGLLAPSYFKYGIPLAAIFTSLIISGIIVLINIGSPMVLSIVLSMFNSTLLASYGIVISCLLWHRFQGRKLLDRRYSLRWGGLINVLALLYIAPYFVFSFFPAAPNPTPQTMNWAIVMFGGIFTLATVYYIVWSRNTYQPPTETTEKLIERDETEVETSDDVARSKELDV